VIIVQQTIFIIQQIIQIVIKIQVGILHNVQIISQGRRHPAVLQYRQIPHKIMLIELIIIQIISQIIIGIRRTIIQVVSERQGVIMMTAQVICGVI
jgi:hypothetical protein